MAGKLDRCRHCGAVIPAGAAVYGDHNRKYCSASCARAQLDAEQGSGRVLGHLQLVETGPPPRGPRAGPAAASRRRGRTTP